MDDAQTIARLNTFSTAIDRIGAETTALIAEIASLKTIVLVGATSPEADAAFAKVEAQLKVVDDLVVNLPAPPAEPPVV